jgi:zinc protease
LGAFLTYWSAPAAAQVAAAAPATAPSIERYQLQNGLRVVLAPDRVTAGVSVVVRYDVGRAQTPTEYRGLAHLVEHLTFRGSRHVKPLQGAALLQELGAGFNATTDDEATTYYTQIAAPGLESALWLESERMAFTLDRLDQAALELEARVVNNEQLQAHSSVRRLSERYWRRALYGEHHPFATSIDQIDDVSEVPLSAVQWFFQASYRPDNAILVLVGDLDPTQARALVERYFGPIASPRVARLAKRAEPPGLCGLHRIDVSHDALFGNLLRVSWPLLPASSAVEQASLSMLSQLLERRLYGALVRGSADVASVDARISRFSSHQLLTLDLDLHEHANVKAVEQTILGAAHELATRGARPQELRVVRANLTSSFIFAREDGVKRAIALAAGEDPDAEAAALGKLSEQDVLRAARPLVGPVILAHVWPSKHDGREAQVEEDVNPCR